MTALVLSYDKCSTCQKALKWLNGRGVTVKLRPIVDAPPTVAELGKWIKVSGLPLKKWLNTSGLSYRALGKAAIDAASDAELVTWLAKDGKLVKRPVVVVDDQTVLVGFDEAKYAAVFGPSNLPEA